MVGYSKEFLIDAFLWRYTDILLTKENSDLDKFVKMVYNYYSTVTKEKFRESCSLSADEIKKFRLATGR